MLILIIKLLRATKREGSHIPTRRHNHSRPSKFDLHAVYRIVEYFSKRAGGEWEAIFQYSRIPSISIVSKKRTGVRKIKGAHRKVIVIYVREQCTDLMYMVEFTPHPSDQLAI